MIFFHLRAVFWHQFLTICRNLFVLLQAIVMVLLHRLRNALCLPAADSSLSTSSLSSRSKPRGSQSDSDEKSRGREGPTINTDLNQTTPLCQLPVEILQYIAAFLSASDAASFSLTSRYVCYAIGLKSLHMFIQSGQTLAEKRRNVEILERAYPSHWYCAWCDRFHEHERRGGPTCYREETMRECAAFSSFLSGGDDYVVCYHHVRLAMNRVLWGNNYGIPVEHFGYTEDSETRLSKNGKVKVPTSLLVEAKIVHGHLILHSTFKVTITTQLARQSGTEHMDRLYSSIPHIVSGHRDNEYGHTGLRNIFDLALAYRTKQNTQLCSTCATDFLVAYDPSPGKPHENILKVQTWRDLGTGRSPFDPSWRAHGESLGLPTTSTDIIRLTSFRAGQIREAFQTGCSIEPGDASWRDAIGMQWNWKDRMPDVWEDRSWTQDIIDARSFSPNDGATSHRGRRLTREERARRNNSRLIREGPVITRASGIGWSENVHAGVSAEVSLTGHERRVN